MNTGNIKIAFAFIILCFPGALHAQKTIDGDFSLGEWDPVLEKRADNTDTPWGPNNDLVNLYVSWDLTNLYVGVEGYNSANNVFCIYIDSSSRSTGAEQNDYYPGFKTQSEGWDPDFIHAVCEMENGIGADVRRIQVDGSTVTIPGAQNASLWPFNNTNGLGGWEMAIPWSVVGTEIGGSIKVAAGLGWATDKYNTTAPLGGGSGDELGADQDADNLSLDNPVYITYDEDNDGIPDEIGSGADSVVVRFEFYAPNATTVNLAGDFNDWCNPSGPFIDTAIDPMSDADGDSIWTLDKKILVGYHEYKFVEDGSIWYTDPRNPDYNAQGDNNSILVVYNPLVYYLDPIEGSQISEALPEVGASIAKSDTSALDLDELKIYIDDALVASGTSYYDTLSRRVSYTVTDSLFDGIHELKISIRNLSGDSHADSSLFSVVLDFLPPVITHIPIPNQHANSPVTVEAVITDDKGVESATLYFRRKNDWTTQSAPMFEGFDDTWYGEIPVGIMTDGATIEYYIMASDKVNTTRAPDAGVFSFFVFADNEPPVISEHFASPSVISPDDNGSDDIARISFRLSEPVYIDIDMLDAGGDTVKTIAQGVLFPAGYSHVLWPGTDSIDVTVANGTYRCCISGIDQGGNGSDTVEDTITVDSVAPDGKLKVILLFHANQNVNYQGDTANDVCFNGILRTFMDHPDSKAMMHFSGTLLHVLQWYSYRHSPSSIDMLAGGAATGQYEIVGSTYSQNIPYSTHMWDNDVEVDVQREVIERSLGVVPTSFWNAERCWKQQLVPLIADNGYDATWVETHILFDSGTTIPEHAVRKTKLGDDELIIFNDDNELIGILDWAINSGNTTDLVNYLSYLHSEDTYRDYAITYCQDAEATGLWDYEGGYDPQPNWDNLDHILDVLESLDWVELTTFSDYLSTRYPTEMLVPIVDGQANWMVGPSQGAGWDDWFDYNENSPLLAFYRDFYATWRERIQGLQERVVPGSAKEKLIEHALRNFAAHQFEFGCIGCGGYYCQDWHKMETLEAACLAAEYAETPVQEVTILSKDVNGDGANEMVVVTGGDFYAFSPYGGRLLYWYDLQKGEQIVGNEMFMWGYYYLGWRDFYSGPGDNDDYHYMQDFEWDAPYLFPAAQPYSRMYGIRKKCLNEFLSIDGSPQDQLLEDNYSITSVDDTLRFIFNNIDFRFEKSYYPVAGGLAVHYKVKNWRSYSRHFVHRIENAFNPSLIEAMDYGRESLKYTDGSDTSSVVGPGTAGVVNAVTGTQIMYSFDPAPGDLVGRRDIYALQLNPEYTYDLGDQEEIEYSFVMDAGILTDAGGDETSPKYPYNLFQNYPNPFNPVTRIDYSVGSRGRVTVRIYDVNGRLVRVLIDSIREPGRYSVEWKGNNNRGRPVGSGIYFCRMDGGGYSGTKKLILLR